MWNLRQTLQMKTKKPAQPLIHINISVEFHVLIFQLYFLSEGVSA